MRPSFRAFMEGLIDYAGLFPPAELPLEQAARNYARYRQGPDSWMLGRFICPAARLAELADLMDELFASGPLLTVSVLGRGGKSAEDYSTNLAADRRDLRHFQDSYRGRAAVDVYETRFPAEALAPGSEDLAAVLARASADILPNAGNSKVFFELGFGPSWRSVAEALLGRLERHEDFRCGLKVRCGGAKPAAYPSADDVAAAVVLCRDHAMPFKATAGLHHPFRRRGLVEHGFVNVFGAAILAGGLALPEETVRAIVADENPEHFAFDKAEFRWNAESLTAKDVAEERSAATSFGSCSFDEPRDDLRALGLLE
jgi:hypothetical protein